MSGIPGYSVEGPDPGWRIQLSLWSLSILFACFSIPAVYSRLTETIDYISLSPEARREARMSGMSEPIRNVESVVPLDEPVLLDVQQAVADLYVDRQLNYWLYPRPVFSSHALGMQNVDAAQFIREKRIQWVLRSDGSVVHIDPDTMNILPMAKPSLSPSPARSLTPIRKFVGVHLGLLYFLFLGWCVLSGTGIAYSLSGSLERLAVSFLVGTALAASWALLCFITGIGISLWIVLLPAFPSLLLFVLGRRFKLNRTPGGVRSSPSINKPLSLMDKTALTLAALLFCLFLFLAMGRPMGGGDERFQWAFKAKAMLHENSIWESGFQGPNNLHLHPRYPLLIPGAEAVLFLFAGGVDDQFVKVLFPWILGAGLLILYSSLRSFSRGTGINLCILTFLLVPFYCGYDMFRDGAAAFTAYPDIAISIFLLAAFVYLFRGQSEGNRSLCMLSCLMLVMVYLTKAEGKMYSALFLFLLAVWMICKRRDKSRTLGVAAIFLVGLVLIVAHEVIVTNRIHPGLLPDDYSRLLTWDRLLANKDRIPFICSSMADNIFLYPRLGFFGFLLLGTCLISRRTILRAKIVIPLVFIGCSLVSYCIPFVLITERWKANISWASVRLVSQLLPLSFWVIFTQLLHQKSSSREAKAADSSRS